MKKHLLIAGGSGLIGSALALAVSQEHWDITVLSRSSGPGKIVWDPGKEIIHLQENQSYDAIINLAGSSISEGRWTKKKKEDIYHSRINACRTLEKYIRDGSLRTSFYLGASGIGIYGDRGSSIVNEDTVIDHTDHWFIKTVIDWEAAHMKIASLGIRTVVLRTGIVLSKKGGAMKEILETPGIGVLSYFGQGRQIWPWIHIEDVSSMILYCMNHAHITGVYNATAPHPVSNKELIKTANQFISPKRIVVGVPKIILTPFLGEMVKVVLESCNASSEKIQKEGFVFSFPEIDVALKNLI